MRILRADALFLSLVERTKTRPIASGAISVPAALLFLLAHSVVFFGILALAGYQA